ncbi:Ubiquitin-like protein [Gnomoniopsis smithogilvyi]|uniref:Ubiquitin-like protein ATG12 n=1 Tax=Gnomoniopsis smithogilvyi TaxID=1191159 RepID=A0A9W8YU93_9PEZI|nr:Ubiquitin-like protein [Gnomoniopsis smithogilvyi]
MASSHPPSTATPPIGDDEIPSHPSSPTIPLTMSASIHLSQLPRSATVALAEANASLSTEQKIVVRFKPVGGSAPSMPPKRELSRISASQKFESVVAYLRRVLKVKDGEALFLYVNATFAPALDEVVGNLWRCFKDSNDQLNVGYSMTPAFG